MRKQRGITLVALVITIIIMLILVAVTIYAAFGENGLIARAREASDRWKEEKEIEMGLENSIDWDNLIGKNNNNKKPPVLDDFTHKEGEVEDGYVVEDLDGDEFVWVPVPNAILDVSSLTDDTAINNAIEAKMATGVYPMAVKLNDGNYSGVLYNFALNEAGNGVKITLATGIWEPKVLDSDSAVLDYGVAATREDFRTQLQNDYNNMVKSVASYGGFFIGRYETSFDRKAESVAGVSPMTAEPSSGNTWWGMYLKQSYFAVDHGITDATSGMIWGSQWDQVMIWMKDVPNPDSVNGTPFYILDSWKMAWQRNNGNTMHDTGDPIDANKSNMVKNVYDMAGNMHEWTMESAWYNSARSIRGRFVY